MGLGYKKQTKKSFVFKCFTLIINKRYVFNLPCYNNKGGFYNGVGIKWLRNGV